jgi:hypothetical protein
MFDIDALDAADTADMEVLGPDGRLTGWIWTFAGPGHPQTITQSNRIARERLHEDSQKEAARVNGRKWKPPEETVDQVRAKNIEFVVERLVGWQGATRGGKEFPYSPENAREILQDRRKAALLTQALEFLGEASSFTQSSATNSQPSPSDTSN